MESLDLLLSDFAEVEYGIDALLVVLRALEEMYDMEREEVVKANLTVIIRQLASLREDLREDISTLDMWMIKKEEENKKEAAACFMRSCLFNLHLLYRLQYLLILQPSILQS